MSASTIRKALGTLQDDADDAQAWSDLEAAVGFVSACEPLAPPVGSPALDPSGDPDLSRAELASLVAAARLEHASRQEDDAVARLLSIEAALAHGTPSEADRLGELGRILDEVIFDDARATAVSERLRALRPRDSLTEEAVDRGQAKRAKWSELVTKYVEEAKSAEEAPFKSSLLMSAAEVAYRYGRPALKAQGKDSAKKAKKVAALGEEIISGLREAIEIDPKNRRAAMLLARMYREEGKGEELAGVLEHLATNAPSREEMVSGFLKLARVHAQRFRSPERAAAAYERVLDLAPGHPEATRALVDFFTARELWDHLVALYDEQLATAKSADEPGTVLQVAMVHWRKRNRPEQAEPYFERLRKLDPGNSSMLAFFRQWAPEHGGTPRLMAILADAQRVLPEGADRRVVTTELAQLAEDGANASKAIEQWRVVYRQDPGNDTARDALKRLYRQTAGWNALTDLLRVELERVPADAADARLAILREVAAIYREHIKSESSLVTVLSQIVAIDTADVAAVRELARVYESLARWRDLLAIQGRLAELEPDVATKVELYRATARRWLDQFSNVQNSIEAYEQVFALAPDDDEARDKLRELYTKRRAYKPLFELLDREATRMPEGQPRRELWLEMARLASERLDRGADATKLYKRVLAEDASAPGALDALERQAERDKDWVTVAEVLERRATSADDEASKLAVLQKLGSVYADRLLDHKGSMSAWHRVLDLSPGNAKALRVLRESYLAVGDYDGLTQLYAATSDWEGLVEVLSAAADKVADPTSRVELSFRATDVYTQKRNAPERAFRAYERILQVQPSDLRAASALIPLYERDEKWSRLPALYEVLYAQATDDAARISLLAKLTRVSGEHLQDRAAAFGYATRAYQLAPGRPGAVEEYEGAARAAGEWEQFVAILKVRAGANDAAGPERRSLRGKVAQIFATELARVEEAVAAYRQLVEEDENDDVIVQTLDRLLRSRALHDDLRWLLSLRVARADRAAKLEILNEWAVLEEESLGAPERAVAVHRQIVELSPTHGASLRALARLLRAAGDAGGAVAALERDRDLRDGVARADAEIELASMYLDPLERYTDALSAAERALGLVTDERGALPVVEKLLNVDETRARAAVVLEARYGLKGNLTGQAEVLEVMIATAASKDGRVELYGRLADVHVRLGAPGRAFDVVARAAAEFPGELDLWDRLDALAVKTDRAVDFVAALARAVPPIGETGLDPAIERTLAERAAILYEDKLGEIDHARPYLERLLANTPSDARAFARLRHILTTRERWTDLESLYERVIGVTDDPTRKVELLRELAIVAEEILADHDRATRLYERVLAIDPADARAVRALDALYVTDESWEKLSALLEGQLQAGAAQDPHALKLRMGKLLFEKLATPDRALDHFEAALLEEPGDRDARAFVERCLDLVALRERAARTLEQVYDAKDDARDLVRVLDIRLEFAREPAEVRELLRRVAHLRDERLKDDASAFSAFARLIPLDPDDVHARARALEIARRTSEHDRIARVLIEAAANARVPEPRAEILTQVARIYEDFLADPARAEAIYRQVLEIDPTDSTIALPAARSLERLYAAATRTKQLAEILEIQVKLEDGSDARRELYGRLGELYLGVLDDPAASIVAWKARVDEDASDVAALAALDRLFERTARYRELVDVLRARERLGANDAERKSLLRRIAQTLAGHLGEADAAISAYRVIVDDYGPDRETLAALAGLYAPAGRWPELAETLETELALAESPGDRLDLLAQIGEVRRARLADIDGALEAYGQALGIDAAHAPTRAALEGLLSDAKARRQAASILRPLYEAEATPDRLLRVLDIELELNESSEEKLALYAQAAAVAEGQLSDGSRAYEYSARALKEATADDDLSTWLDRTERLAASTGRHRDFVAILAVLQPASEDRQLEIHLKVASIAGEKLTDRDLALDYFRKALEVRPDERRALNALAALYEQLDRPEPLLEIVRRQAEVEEDLDARLALRFKQAALSDERMHDSSAAIEVYEQILDESLDDRAVGALDRLYTETSRWGDLIALYERQLGTGDLGREQKADVHYRLGLALQLRLLDVDRAVDQYEEALALEPQHGGTVASLEDLMRDPAQATRAAEMLESVYLARAEWSKVMVALEARLAACDDPETRRTLLKRLAKLHEEQKEDYRAALETNAKLLVEDVTDESTWAELERLARVANAESRLAEIFAGELDKIAADEPITAKLAHRTGELFEATSDAERALQFYRRAYAFAPDERDGPFAAIDRILREGNRPADRVALFREALDHTGDPAGRIETLHAIARIEEVELKDDERAIETYRGALDVDDTDVGTLEAISRLYQRRSRWRDLADLVRRRAEQSAMPDEEATFRVELAGLLERKLGEVDSAIDEYHAVVDLTTDAPASLSARDAVRALEQLVMSPEHKARAVEILRPIYERADDWRQLIAVNGERLALTAEPSEQAVVLRETARLWEERGNDRDRAFDAVREAFVIDPDDGETRGELDRLAVATSRWDDLASAYERGLSHAEPLGQRELLLALANVHDARRDDPRRALGAYERLHRLDEADVDALDAIDVLATLLSDWPALVRVLVKKADLTPSDLDRAEIWRRVGECRRDMLEDAKGAREAYERALELDADSPITLDHLIRLCEATDDSKRLVDLYRQRVELASPSEEALKYDLLLRAATRYEGLKEPREAIELLNHALVVLPGDRDAMVRLDALYQGERLWPELLENLRLQAGTAVDDAERRALKRRIGDLLSAELEDPRQALEAYREVLDGGPEAAVIAAIRRIGEEQDDLRVEAADALEPVLRAAGRHAELIEVHEMRLRAQSDGPARAHTLRAIAEVAERELADNPRAESALLRALAEEPEDEALHAEIERLATVVGEGGWRRYADALAERATSTFDGTLTTRLFVRLGRVAEERLCDNERASKAYALALEQSGDAPDILRALDRVYARMGDSKALGDILERRVGVEADAREQAALYCRLASLQINAFGQRSEGVGTLRLALDRQVEHAESSAMLEGLLDDGELFDEVFEVLERAYRQLGRTRDVAVLYERRVGRASVARERSRARLDLARVFEEDVGDPERAQRVVEDAVAADPSDEGAVDELVRLASRNAGWRQACDAIERSLNATEDLPSATAAALWMKLAEWRRDRLDDGTGAESSFRAALRLVPDDLAVIQAVEAIQRAPGREADLVATLRTRAKIEPEIEVKRALLREAQATAEGTLQDRSLAEAVLRDILLEDEADSWALEELTRLRELAGDSADVVALLLRRAELAGDGEEIVDLKRRAAVVLDENLRDSGRAIALYEEIFEQEPGDEKASTRLRSLYVAAGRLNDLARLLARLTDAAVTPEARSRLRLDLARLEEQEFQASDRAAATLRSILDEEAGHPDAVRALLDLLERTGKDEELAELLDTQIQIACERGDREAELALRVRLGEVFEVRIKDTARAIVTYQDVLVTDPSHLRALEAIARLAESRFDWELVSTALGRIVELATDASGVPAALRLAFARAHFEDSKGIQAALERALELDPRNKDVRIQLRGMFEKEKKWTELAALMVGDVDLLTESAGTSPDAVAAEQIKLLRRVADIHVHERLSPADAIRVLERASTLAPHDREILLHLVDAYTATGRDPEAASVLERLIASFGAKRSKELSVYHHRLGRALAAQGDKVGGLAQYDLAFKIDPGSVGVLKDLGVLALESGDLDRAQKTFRALLLQRLDATAGITKGEVFLYLGEISATQGDKAKALQMVERAIENEPTLERARARLQELKVG